MTTASTASACATTTTPATPPAVDSTKALARAFIERFDANDIPGAVALLSDDVRYWLAGKPAELPGIGLHDKAQIAKVFGRMDRRLEGGLRMKVLSIIAEGDTAAMEVQSHGLLKNGRHYDNEYHFRMRVRDGLICEVREYYDSLHVHTVWYLPEPAAA